MKFISSICQKIEKGKQIAVPRVIRKNHDLLRNLSQLFTSKSKLNSDSGVVIILQALLLSWPQIFYRLLRNIFMFIRQMMPIQMLYLSACLGMVVTSLYPWIVYSLNFFETERYISSSQRWFFFLTSLTSMLLLLGNFNYKRLYALLILLANFSCYLLGVLYPNVLHTSLIETNYNFTIPFWIYGATLTIAIFCFVPALQHSCIPLGSYRSYLLKSTKSIAGEKVSDAL